MGRAHNTASFQYSQLLHKEKISEIHAIMQDKQTSSSSCLKTSSYLMQNQTEEVKFGEKNKSNQNKAPPLSKKTEKDSKVGFRVWAVFIRWK